MTSVPDNSTRAKNALLIFYIKACITVASIVSTFLQINLVNRISKGDFNMEEATANDTRQQLIVYANLGVYIIAIIVFILWFRRAYNNLNLSGRAYTKYDEGWAAGGWFVPFLNLGRPYQIMKEIWEKTQEATHNLLSFKSADIIGWWWGMWITGNVISNISYRMSSSVSIENIRTASYISIAGSIFSAIALVLVIVIIKNVAGFEKNLQASLLEDNGPEAGSEDQLHFITN